ncbi:MAG: VOC family protein [Bergeyella sp.]|nr:VOC family protein [Bergeyella sp.]
MKIHHVALIVSDYERSKKFYTEILDCSVISEVYREEKNSHKLDLETDEGGRLELFSFPHPPARQSYPESCGLRHLAFEVQDVPQKREEFLSKGLDCEEIRIDEWTGKKFFFTVDPDGLPLEFYES